MTRDTLTEWLDYLTELHPTAIEMTLERVRCVGAALNCLNPLARVITVAGTNGKGSTIAYFEAIFLAHHHPVVSYTSPHVLKFNERIRINGEPIDDTSLICAFEEVERVRRTLGISLTYFEFTTLAAFVHFKTVPGAVWLLEIGMGGRLDAVNLIDADVAIVTSIGFDHMEWLGNTLEEIAAEKAGILRPQQAAVIGLTPNECPQTLMDTINRLEVRAHFLERDYPALTLNTNLPTHSASLVHATLRLIENEWSFAPFNQDKVMSLLKRTKLLGRAMLWQKNRVHYLFDVAHNADSVRLLSERWRQVPGAGKRYALVGFLADKAHQEALRYLIDDIDCWYVASLAGPRGYPSALLADTIHTLLSESERIAEVHCFDSVASASIVLDTNARVGDKIVVFGSFITVAEALSFYEIID